MSKLELDKYTDNEIVSSLFKLPANKFLTVVQSLAMINQRIENRSKTISNKYSTDEMDDFMNKLLKGE